MIEGYDDHDSAMTYTGITTGVLDVLETITECNTDGERTIASYTKINHRTPVAGVIGSIYSRKVANLGR